MKPLEMNHLKKIISFFFVLVISCSQRNKEDQDFPRTSVVPSSEQIEYQQMEVIGFIHFGINTFTDREWGTGKEDPDIFNPSSLDVSQWVNAAKTAGMGMLILTAKHHDGFCLWPSAYTNHSVKSSSWENGKGDIVKALSKSCAEAGIKFGIYLSPWDMHEPSYGSDEYNQYYLSQLEELLTLYGTISEVWMDGAKGENARDMEYDFEAYRTMVYELQPLALIFSDVGPDIRWIGNEHGIAGFTNWSTINTDGMEIGDADTDYLNSGDPDGNKWLVGECDVSIRPGWFYHASQDTMIKSPEYLVDLYYKSVGRNGTLLLNLPPDRRGLIHENDIQSLIEFRSILDETFAHNLLKNAKADASSQWAAGNKFDPLQLLDENFESYWAASTSDTNPSVTIQLHDEAIIDRILLQEPIQFGQRINEFTIEAEVEGEWRSIVKGTTIGYKRILRFDPVKCSTLHVKIAGFNSTPALSTVAAYKASSKEKIF